MENLSELLKQVNINDVIPAISQYNNTRLTRGGGGVKDNLYCYLEDFQFGLDNLFDFIGSLDGHELELPEKGFNPEIDKIIYILEQSE